MSSRKRTGSGSSSATAGGRKIRRTMSLPQSQAAPTAAGSNADVNMVDRAAAKVGKRMFAPTIRTVTLRYCDVYTGASGVSPFIQQMACNDCFDPDKTGIGHQPRYFDEYSALYQQYVVRKASIRIVGNSNGTGLVTFRPSNALAAPSSIVDELELPFSKHVICNSDAPFEINAQLDIRRLLALSKEEFEDGDFTVGINSSPPSRLMGNISCQAHDLSTAVSFNFTVELLMEVEFVKPQNHTVS